MTTATTCKARCQEVKPNRKWDPETKDYTGEVTSVNLTFGSPQYDSNPESENGRFFAATPSIHIQLGVCNVPATEMFEVGKDYYVTFNAAD